MSDHEHQTETAFLARCIHYDETGEIHKHEERITQTECEERCLRRAVWLMAALSGFAVVGIGYSVILLKDLPPAHSEVIVQVFCVLGVAALLSLLAYVCLWIGRQNELGRRREECRRLVTKLLAARLGHVPTTLPIVMKEEINRIA